MFKLLATVIVMPSSLGVAGWVLSQAWRERGIVRGCGGWHLVQVAGITAMIAGFVVMIKEMFF